MRYVSFVLHDGREHERLRFLEHLDGEPESDRHARVSAEIGEIEVVLRRERVTTLTGVARALAAVTQAERDNTWELRRAFNGLDAPECYHDTLVAVNRYRERVGWRPTRLLVLGDVAFSQRGWDSTAYEPGLLQAVPCDQVAALRALHARGMQQLQDWLEVNDEVDSALTARLCPAEGVACTVLLHQAQQTLAASGFLEGLHRTCIRIKTLLLRNRRLHLIHTVLRRALINNRQMPLGTSGQFKGGAYILAGDQFSYISREGLELGARDGMLDVPVHD